MIIKRWKKHKQVKKEEKKGKEFLDGEKEIKRVYIFFLLICYVKEERKSFKKFLLLYYLIEVCTHKKKG